MLRALLALLFLVPALVHALPADEAVTACTLAAKDLRHAATLRDQAESKATLVTDILSAAARQRWPEEFRDYILTLIEVAYAAPKLPPDQLAAAYYSACIDQLTDKVKS